MLGVRRASIFVLQNSDAHEIDFLFFDFTAPVVGDLRRCSSCVGVVLDRLLQCWMKRRKARSARRRLSAGDRRPAR